MQYEKIMKKAIELAKKTKNKVNPNPKVGCIIVKNKRIVGQGFHEFFGGNHAEINALNQAGDKARDSIVFVTLEPCSSFGKTPPCTRALINAGVKKVVIGVMDPSVKNGGKGVRALRKAGVSVEVGVLEEECSELIKGFKSMHLDKKPFIALKNAMSLDGKITDFKENSKWISGVESRRTSQELRRDFDAVLVSSNTVKKDNPRLTCRLKNCENPVRIILDSKLSTCINSNVYKNLKKDKVIVFYNSGSKKKLIEFEKKGVRLIRIGLKKNQLNLKKIVEKIGFFGINSVLVEGGGELNFSFLKEKLVNRIYLFVAPIILGGKKSKQFVAGKGFELNKAVKFEKINLREIGKDLLIQIDLELK